MIVYSQIKIQATPFVTSPEERELERNGESKFKLNHWNFNKKFPILDEFTV
ncbi:MAG: hypothetical protein IPK10_02045 [Bacteroidetes bacterium]|nr:hypothetical protein [Bacteroidota bacterium]